MMNNPRRALESKELSCSAAEPSCELYRSTAVGKSLMESLKVMVGDDRMPPSLAVRVMKAFDRCMYVALERDYAENGAQVVKINPKTCTTFKNIESVWTFQLEDVMVEAKYFLRRHVQDNHLILSRFLEDSTPGAAGKFKDTPPSGGPETGQIWVKSMKLTVADERMYNFDAARRKKVGRPPKDDDGGGPSKKKAKT